jgi:hypothetical protein
VTAWASTSYLIEVVNQMNPEKMRRQAAAFVEELTASWEGVSANDIETEVKCLEGDWATPILIDLWSTTVVNPESPLVELRPSIKRAIIELRVRDATGTNRSHAQLMRLLAACQDAIEDHLQMVVTEFELREDDDRRMILRSAGSHLQLAADANALGRFPDLATIARIIDGGDPNTELSELPHLRHVPAESRYSRIWRGLYLRYAVMLSVVRFNGNIDIDAVAALPERFFSQTWFGGDRAPSSVIFTSADIRELLVTTNIAGKPGQNDREITAYPLHPVVGGYVSSVALIADSIAPWLQQTVHELDLWNEVVSGPFEREVLEFMRAQGFAAGGVDENGRWQLDGALDEFPVVVQTIADALASHTGSPGEIDALGWHPGWNQLILLECKSINSIGNLQSVATTLSSSDAEGWRRKLEKKAEWVEAATGYAPLLSAVVLEGIEFLYAFHLADTPILGRQQFEYFMTAAFATDD